MKLLQERIIGNVDRVQDVLMLGMASKAALSAVQQARWAGVHRLRLSHAAPSPAKAACIASKCPNLRELDATGCTQLTPDSLQALAHVAFEVLLVRDCRSFSGNLDAAMLQIIGNGQLRVLEAAHFVPESLLGETPAGQTDLGHLISLSLTSIKWGLRESATLFRSSPGLRELQLESCDFSGHGRHRGAMTDSKLKLEHLGLTRCSWADRSRLPFLSPHLRSLDVSRTTICDDHLRTIADTCSQLERLNIRGCTCLTDDCLLYLTSCQAIKDGRLWDLNIEGLQYHGPLLGNFLSIWSGSRSVNRVPNQLRLNVANNLSLQPVDLHGLLPDCNHAVVYLQHFLAESCTKLAGTYSHKGTSCNILRELSLSGVFERLQVLDLRNVFSTTHQSHGRKSAVLTAIIRGTSGSLNRLLIDNACACDDVALAIAGAGSCLQELSMPCCNDLTDSGLRCIAAACTQLRRLSVGGPQRTWTETDGLAGFSGLRELEICRRALMVDEQLMRVLGRQPALECFKLSSCSRVTDAALASLPADSLRELSLVSCGGVQGTSIFRLRKLETLEMGYCNAVGEDTIQIAAVSCTRLKKLQLPNHLHRSCIPFQAAGHLIKLVVYGGTSDVPSLMKKLG